MKAKKIYKFKEGKRIKKVTHVPNFVLRFKGKHDSKKPETAANSYCDKLCSRCAALENHECVMAEEILHPSRLEASQILASVNNSKIFLKHMPHARVETSALDIRANSRNRATKSNTEAEVKVKINRLCELNEIIINTNATLEQRIEKTRNICREKINAYMIGLRAGGIPEYDYEINFSNAAMESYSDKHAFGDKAIREQVERLYTAYEEETT